MDVTNHTIRSDSCQTVKTTCHIGLPDHLRRGTSIEYFPPVFQCWCWCAEPCDSIVGKNRICSQRTGWMPSITRFLSLHRERVRHGPVRYLRCLWRDLGFFLFFFFLIVLFFVLFLQVWIKSVFRLIIEYNGVGINREFNSRRTIQNLENGLVLFLFFFCFLVFSFPNFLSLKFPWSSGFLL